MIGLKTVGSNLVGSVIEAKLGNSFATPYLRETSTNAFDKVYDTLGKENNEKKWFYWDYKNVNIFDSYGNFIFSI